MNSELLTSLAALIPCTVAQIGGLQSDSSLMWWLLGLAFIAVIFNQAAAAWKTLSQRFEEKPAGNQYRSRRDCIEIHADLKQDIKEMNRRSEENDNALRLEVKNDVRGIHGRLDLTNTRIADMCTTMTGAIRELSGQVNQMNHGGHSE